jgi:hypothetical protein
MSIGLLDNDLECLKATWILGIVSGRVSSGKKNPKDMKERLVILGKPLGASNAFGSNPQRDR